MTHTLALLTLVAMGPTQPPTDTLRSKSNDALKTWNVPGAYVVVVAKDKVLFSEGVGFRDLATKQSVTSKTIFPLASCTKAFTATLIAQLQDKGTLTFDDPIHKHWPEYQHPDASLTNHVTIRDLLSHRTGVGGHDLLWYRAPWGQDEVFQRHFKLPQEGQFRSSYLYSSTQVALAGAMAARAAKGTWADLVKAKLIDPLGMKGVSLTSKAILANAEKATGYRKDNAGVLEISEWYETKEPNASGSICLTGPDLVPWLQMLLRKGSLPNRQTLVSARSLAETMAPLNPIPLVGELAALNPDTQQMSYAMGWVVYDYRGQWVVAHGGMIDGFKVQVTLLPKADIAVAVLSNVYETRMNQALTNTLVDCCLGFPAKDWNAILGKVVAQSQEVKVGQGLKYQQDRKAELKPSLELEKYVGKYNHPAYGEGVVILEKEKLVWKWSSFTCKLEHWESDVFQIQGGYFQGRFVQFRVEENQAKEFLFEEVVFKR